MLIKDDLKWSPLLGFSHNSCWISGLKASICFNSYPIHIHISSLFFLFLFFFLFSCCDHTWVFSNQAQLPRGRRRGKVGAQCLAPRCSQQEWGQGAEPRGNPTLVLVLSVVSQNLPVVCEPQLGRVSCELGLRPTLSAGA